MLGTDLAEGTLAVARLHAVESGVDVQYRQISAEALAAEAPGAFDVVTCLEMIEHVPDPQSIVSACATLAKPGGHVFFSTINRNPKAWALAVVGAEYRAESRSARHARLSQIHPPVRTRARTFATRASTRGKSSA